MKQIISDDLGGRIIDIHYTPCYEYEIKVIIKITKIFRDNKEIFLFC